MKTLILLVAGGLLMGCSSVPTQDVSEVAKAFYAQPRTYKSVELTGATEITIKGENLQVSIANELAPLSMIPKDPGIAVPLIGAIKDTVLMGLGIYTGGEVMKQLAERPQVISQQVVRPEYVIVEP